MEYNIPLGFLQRFYSPELTPFIVTLILETKMKNNNINIIVSWLILNKQKKNICYLCFSIKDHFSFAIFRFESPEKSAKHPITSPKNLF